MEGGGVSWSWTQMDFGKGYTRCSARLEKRGRKLPVFRLFVLRGAESYPTQSPLVFFSQVFPFTLEAAAVCGCSVFSCCSLCFLLLRPCSRFGPLFSLFGPLGPAECRGAGPAGDYHRRPPALLAAPWDVGPPGGPE